MLKVLKIWFQHRGYLFMCTIYAFALLAFSFVLRDLVNYETEGVWIWLKWGVLFPGLVGAGLMLAFELVVGLTVFLQKTRDELKSG